MIVNINEAQAKAIVDYFEWEFLPYVQDQLNFYQEVKNALKQENDKKTLDILQDVCYNNITVKECDNSATDNIDDVLDVCSCYDANGVYESYGCGTCLGTRECDPCYCGGDVRKCDFYPEKRG